jgi:hypothetical protein
MCNRPEEVERVSKLGQPVKSTLCKTQDHQGNARCCPYFDVCAYRSQFKNLSDKKMVRFEAHNYLTLPITAEERTIGLRIFDETFWRSMGRSVTLTVDELSTARSLGDCQNETEAANRKLVVNRLLGCMSEIASALRQGRPIIEAVIDYSANDLEMFALAEKWSDHRLPFLPDASASVIAHSLTVSEANKQQVGAKVQFWSILADAKLWGLQELQSVQFISDHKPHKLSDARDVIKVFWHVMPPCDVPVIILDADADPILIEPFFQTHLLHETHVKPNADITYIIDKTFSKTALMRKPAREEWRRVIWSELLRDGGGGVLVIATKAVVKSFFADEGYDFCEMDDREANAVMLDTRLHGVQWAWFGPMTLGSNRWKHCTTCIVIGREEWPTEALEAEARKLWGYGLQLIEHDEAGNCMLPEVDMAFPMDDGKIEQCVKARAHPDPHIKAIQAQARESATRQGVERLRLANAVSRKRVLIGSKIPIPGLPASQLITWAEYSPSKCEAALAEANGALRISPKGLTTDAPRTFPTAKSAGRYAEKNNLVKALFDPLTSNNNYIRGWGAKTMVLVAFRVAGVRGSVKTRAIIVCDPHEVERIANAKWGKLTSFEILKVAAPTAELTSHPLCCPSTCTVA